jgi:hypothetical protein
MAFTEGRSRKEGLLNWSLFGVEAGGKLVLSLNPQLSSLPTGCREVPGAAAAALKGTSDCGHCLH